MSGPELRLLAWLTRAAQLPGCAVEARHDEVTQCRGLCVRQRCSAGDSLLRVPWDHVLTVQSAVRRLSSLERRHQPLTRLPLAEVLQLAAAASTDLLPHGTGWSLLLTLQLLAELRDKRSPLGAYVATLPAPSGSALCVAAHGPAPGCHLSLCTPAQLECLNCPALAHAVLIERARLRQLHAALFGDHAAPLSFESFAWAHALVASRAIGLCIDATDAPSLRCLVPGIDLCNHSRGASSSLRLTTAAAAPAHSAGAHLTPSAVELVAAGDLADGTACLLDYGAHRLRQWCATYSFVPDDDGRAEETYEEVALGDTGREQLLVTSSGAGTELRLTTVLLAHDGAITYHVSDRDPAHATRVVLDDRLLRFLPPAEEERMCSALGAAAGLVAARMAREEDAFHELACAADADATAANRFTPPCAHLAAQFRTARLQLLRRAAEGVLAHTTLLGQCR
jgi:hypothetical protein